MVTQSKVMRRGGEGGGEGEGRRWGGEGELLSSGHTIKSNAKRGRRRGGGGGEEVGWGG